MTRWAAAAGFWLFLALVLLWSLFPFYYGALSSLKGAGALFQVDYLPRHWDLSNYRAVFAEQPFGRNIANSLGVATITVALSLALAVGAAYTLGRVRFRGRGLTLGVILGATMFPQVAVLAGLFELVRHLGLYNHPGALVLSYLIFTLPFKIGRAHV
mgnify:FL=1